MATDAITAPGPSQSIAVSGALTKENKSRLEIKEGKLFYNYKEKGSVLWGQTKTDGNTAVQTVNADAKTGELAAINKAILFNKAVPVHTIDLPKLIDTLPGKRKNTYQWANGRDLQVDTFINYGDWNQYRAYDPSGKAAGTKKFEDPGSYKREDEKGEK